MGVRISSEPDKQKQKRDRRDMGAVESTSPHPASPNAEGLGGGAWVVQAVPIMIYLRMCCREGVGRRAGWAGWWGKGDCPLSSVQPKT